MNESLNTPGAQVVAMLLIAVGTGIAFWIGEGFASALPPFLVLLAFTALVAVGRRRSGTVEVMSGLGDERTRSLYLRAVAIAGTVMSFVLPGWWLVTVAQGEANDTLALLCLIFGLSFVTATVVLARRG